MKNRIIKLAAFSIIMVGINACNTPAENVAAAEKKVIEANNDLDDANRENAAEIEKFRKEAADKVAANEKIIADFKARMEFKKLEADEEYEKKILALEKKNSDLKKKLDDYQVQGLDQWQAFKTEFAKDMADLGNAFKGIAVSSDESETGAN